jgi:preprotein translocase subunit YajC
VGFLIFILLLFAAMWLLIVLPQRRRQAAHKNLIEALKPGDEVLTAGGLYGDVTEVGEDEVALEIAPGVEVRVAARAIATVIPPDAYEEEEDEAEAGVPPEPAIEDAVPADEPPDREGSSIEPDRR